MMKRLLLLFFTLCTSAFVIGQVSYHLDANLYGTTSGFNFNKKDGSFDRFGFKVGALGGITINKSIKISTGLFFDRASSGYRYSFENEFYYYTDQSINQVNSVILPIRLEYLFNIGNRKVGVYTGYGFSIFNKYQTLHTSIIEQTEGSQEITKQIYDHDGKMRSSVIEFGISLKLYDQLKLDLGMNWAHVKQNYDNSLICCFGDRNYYYGYNDEWGRNIQVGIQYDLVH